MNLRVIGNELEYSALLDEAKELALQDPPTKSAPAIRLEIIAVLLEKYEAEQRLKETETNEIQKTSNQYTYDLNDMSGSPTGMNSDLMYETEVETYHY